MLGVIPIKRHSRVFVYLHLVSIYQILGGCRAALPHIIPNREGSPLKGVACAGPPREDDLGAGKCSEKTLIIAMQGIVCLVKIDYGLCGSSGCGPSCRPVAGGQ